MSFEAGAFVIVPFEVPTAWRWVQFSEIANVASDLVDPAGFLDFPHVAPNHIESGTGRLLPYSTIRADGVTSAKNRFKPGQILYSKIRPNLAKVVLVDFDGLCSADVYPVNTSLHAGYLHRWMLTPEFTSLTSGRQSRNLLPKINVKELSALPVPVPGAAEQRRIAYLLDQIDALRVRQRTAIDLLGELTRSIFMDMFGHSEAGWPPVTISDLVERESAIRTGPFGSQLLHEQFVASGVAVLGIDNAVENEFKWRGRRFITAEKYAKLVRYKVYPGDVLITIMGTCGRCAIAPDDISLAINTKHLCCITLDRSKCLPEFLHSYFLIHPTSRRYLERHAKGAVMAGLNMGIVKELPIDLPPIGLQKSFVGRVRAVQQLKAAHKSHLVALDALFASVRHRAFRGEA